MCKAMMSDELGNQVSKFKQALTLKIAKIYRSECKVIL